MESGEKVQKGSFIHRKECIRKIRQRHRNLEIISISHTIWKGEL